MLGSHGCLVPELLSSFGDVALTESTWFRAGGLIHAQSVLAVVFLQVLLMGLRGGYRVAGGPLGEAAGLYPGDSFDPLGLGEDPPTLSELQLKEIKNGRLSMLAMLGPYVQSIVTGKGPVANWSDHIADPSTSNGFAYATRLAPRLNP